MDKREIEERMKRIEEERQQLLAELPSLCDVLGIEYKSELDDDADKIKEAAKQKPLCENCKLNADNCEECYSAERSLYNNYIKCPPYREVLRIKAGKYQAGKSGIGKRFIGKTFDNFNVTDKTQKAYDACKAFATNYKEGETSKGLKLFGSYGCGKTHLVSAIIHKIGENYVDSTFINVPELLVKIKQSFGNDEVNFDWMIEKAKDASLLILDDLGAEKSSDWVREQLYVIINRRYEDMLPTIVTTNCTTAELVDRLGERTVSRLIEMTDAYKITADDYRLKKG